MPQDGAVIQDPAAEGKELGPASSHDTCKQLEKAAEVKADDDMEVVKTEEEKAQPETVKADAEKAEGSDSYSYDYGDSSSEETTTTKKIGVDWHNNVVEIDDHIVENSLNGLKKLEENGWEITIISFAGPKRGREVLTKISRLGSISRNWGRYITPQRVGPEGKADLCLEKGIQYMMDDSAQILKDCQRKGIKILPIMTKFENHGWYNGKRFRTCEQAVQYLLSQ